MKIYKTNRGIIAQYHGDDFLLPSQDWDLVVNRRGLYQYILSEIQQMKPTAFVSGSLMDEGVLAPIGTQEVWASGVTYLRSREARMEESKGAGGGDFYARVYEADRPELFFKAPAYRVVGSSAKVRIRRDSKWNVPEPELALFVSSAGSIEGYTIGNDMSSRDIEGENPLYLPQAKSYDGSTALGPCLLVTAEPIDPDTSISMEIRRNRDSVFAGEISINRMKRERTELVDYLFREMSFPTGVYLMTGTGIIPPDDFTLMPGDEIRITVPDIGTLVNTVSH